MYGDKELHEAAKLAAGNWKSFDKFDWFDEPADAENWALVCTQHSLSGVLGESNADVIARDMQVHVESGDAIPQRFKHFAFGRVKGYAVRVYDDSGNVTPAFRTWHNLATLVEEYVILDEDDYYARLYDETLENIAVVVNRFETTEDDAAEKVYSWLTLHRPEEVEEMDGFAPYPSDEAVEAALRELGLLVDE